MSKTERYTYEILSSREAMLERFESLYEAIMVLAQRARQIGNEQTELIRELQRRYARPDVPKDIQNEEDFDLSETRDPIELPKFPKPTTEAIREALEGKLQWEYSSSSQIQKTDELYTGEMLYGDVDDRFEIEKDQN
ncbi:MAG: DNA-directed RNA polymerase subunit omega [bacterium]|nr:DNA-directed RNA polymerase subunit omega [bacterium]